MHESTRVEMKRNIAHWYMKAIASIRKAMSRMKRGTLSEGKPNPPRQCSKRTLRRISVSRH